MNFIIRTCISLPQINILKISIKLLAFAYIYFDRNSQAVNTLERLRDVALEDQDYPLVMFAWKQMGSCFQKKHDYQRALVCYKNLMHEAWRAGDVDYEMQAYEDISK